MSGEAFNGSAMTIVVNSITVGRWSQKTQHFSNTVSGEAFNESAMTIGVNSITVGRWSVFGETLPLSNSNSLLALPVHICLLSSSYAPAWKQNNTGR
eukprot:810428-Amphidinium_carterae.1